MVQRLNFNNFFKHYIIRPFETPKIDRLKAVISSIAVGILTCGLIHLSVFIKELCIKKIDHLNSLQKRVNQLNPSNSDNHPNAKLTTHPPKPRKLVDLSEPEFSNLSDHLKKMKELTNRNQRDAVIKKMSFLNISQIVLEIREALIQKVRSSIPDTANNIVFLLGPTGAGKSTAACFLRGDEMVLDDDVYESINDKEGLIVHDLSTSGTFLPNVINTENLILVDFPGFDDTNGPLVILGAELALKVLVNEYSPHVLILEAITDVETRYCNAGELGIKLKRLFTNPDDCFLGLTKYNQNIDYANIKNIEIEQNKEKQVSSSILNLQGQLMAIQYLLESEIEPEHKQALTEKKLALEQELEQEIIKHRENENKSPSVNPQILKYQKKIDNLEEELSRQIGIKHVIKFSDLSNPEVLISCREALSKAHKPLEINPQQNLDPNEEELLAWVFQNHLINFLHSYKPDLKDISNRESFYKSVSEHSLIYMIAPPEVRTFLTLPEMDSSLILDYDKRIIDRYVHNYTNVAIGGPKISLLEKILDKISDSKKTARLRELIKRHKEFIKGLLGVKPCEDQQKDEENWKEIEDKHQLHSDEVDQKFELPNWIMKGLFLPDVQITIHKFWQKYGVNPESKELLDEMGDETIDKISSDLEHIRLVLSVLKELEWNFMKKSAKPQNENTSIINLLGK